jgi:outer membrane protein
MKPRLSGALRAALIPALWLVVLSAGAAPARAEGVMTLSDAVGMALLNNLELKQAENSVRSSEISVKMEQADFLPEVSLGVSGSTSSDLSPGGTLTSGDGRTSEAVNARISASVDLYTGNANTASLKRARLELAADKENWSRQKQTVAFETVRQFIQVSGDMELIAVREENLEKNFRQMERIEALYHAGNLSVTDLYQQQVEISTARLGLLEAQNSLEVDKLTLLETIGLPPGTPLEIEATWSRNMDDYSTTQDFRQALDSALANRPDIKALEKGIAAYGEMVKESKAGSRPKVSLFGELGSQYGSGTDGTLSEQILSDNVGATVGVSVSIPLFDGHRTSSAVAQALVNQQNGELTREQLIGQVGVEVGQALWNYRTAFQELQIARDRVQYARQALDSVQERYLVGAATLVEWIQIRTDYVEADYELVTARNNLMTQRAALEYYKGDLEGMLSLFIPVKGVI